MDPLQVLFEAEPARAAGLPARLEELHGGGFELAAGTLYANFVSSLDGVVALDDPGVSSGPAISGRSEADRFLMGLLRAHADCVLIGAGTLRADSGHLWTPAYIHPASAPEFAELRRGLGLSPEPALAVVTSSGNLDPEEKALRGGFVFTSARGAAALEGRVPPEVKLVVMGSDRVPVGMVLDRLRAEGCRRVLSEGGPHLIAELVAGGFLKELFLTLSPVLAGHVEGRLSLLEGLALPAGAFQWGTLASARRQGSHLFLRYRFGEPAAG